MHKALFFVLFLYTNATFSQIATADKKTLQLKEVVVTSQFEPQSIKKSVLNVRLITKEDLQKLAANNLSDVLNQYLHIQISPSSGDGRSTVSMFGLDGNYFKILIDNIPVVGDGSFGNNIDLTQINLNDIEQIEIIEGSMGVTHGANAVSGILNIITKKNSTKKWEINASIQEETAGEEYSLMKKGKHIQSLKINHKLNEKWFLSSGINRNTFGGYMDDKRGLDYAETDLKRGYAWLPKQQIEANQMLRYKHKQFTAFYRFDYLSENIDYYNPVVLVIANPPFGNNKYTNDKRYLTERYYHHLNTVGKLYGLNYNSSFSYQKQTRSVEDFKYDLNYKTETVAQKIKNQATEVWYATGTVSNFFNSSKVDVQLGYELAHNLGYGLVSGENQSFVAIEKTLKNYDFFISSEIKLNEKIAVKPGFRVSFQSLFDTQYASSLGLRYNISSDLDLRFSIGKSFRTPVFEELYQKIKFSGHQFYGNENLIPESSTSYEVSIKSAKNIAPDFKRSHQISSSFLNVNDRIDMAFVGFEPGTTSPIYQYININAYKMWNVSTTHQMEYKNWMANVGLSWFGVSQLMDSGKVVSDDKFLYSMQLNSNISYNLTKYRTLFSIYYKLNGKRPQLVSGTEDGKEVFKISEIGKSEFLDASIKKSFFKNIDFTIGARNLLNVKRISQSLIGGSTHSAGAGILLGYGRSYFIKIAYNL
ncbi:MAG: TonB-dependent receptor [Sphingobacteriaceae bacterium]|nr:TonB-dependent receptor [Sphingobacteriaceae bacterium]